MPASVFSLETETNKVQSVKAASAACNMVTDKKGMLGRPPKTASSKKNKKEETGFRRVGEPIPIELEN